MPLLPIARLDAVALSSFVALVPSDMIHFPALPTVSPLLPSHAASTCIVSQQSSSQPLRTKRLSKVHEACCQLDDWHTCSIIILPISVNIWDLARVYIIFSASLCFALSFLPIIINPPPVSSPLHMLQTRIDDNIELIDGVDQIIFMAALLPISVCIIHYPWHVTPHEPCHHICASSP